MSQGFNCLVYRQLSSNVMVVTTFLFAHTTFLRATCCLIFFIPVVKPFLTHWSWLRVVPFIERGNRAHGGCDRSTGDAYSSMAPDPTSDIFRDPYTPILWFVFPIGLLRLITDRYFCQFIYHNSESFPPLLYLCATRKSRFKPWIIIRRFKYAIRSRPDYTEWRDKCH
jgi:hypothetical protein